MKKKVFLDKFRINSGVLRVARGGSGAKAPPLAVRPKLASWGGSFLLVSRNNAGRLGAGFISVCLETRWLGQKRCFYVPGCYCNKSNHQSSEFLKGFPDISSRHLRAHPCTQHAVCVCVGTHTLAHTKRAYPPPV